MAFRTHALLGLAASLAVAGAANALPTSDYLMKAGASDLYEKTSSQLVLKSANPAVRDFATMMIKDHTTSTAEVKAAAMKSGLHPQPPMLSAKQKSMVAQLTAAKGAARDKLYIDQQKTAHQEALMVQKDYASTGNKAPLKMAAGKIVPVVQHHIAMLQAMPAM